MADDWVDYQKAYMPAPLLGTWGTKWAELSGAEKGDAFALLTDAVLTRWPGTAAADALGRIGADRRIIRAPGETDDAYRARLDGFDFWALSGTEAGIIAALQAAQIAGVVVLEDQDVAGAFGHWARFAVYISDQSVFGAPETWNSFTWGDGTLWGFTGLAQDLVDYTRNVIKQLRPAHTRCLGVVIYFDGVAEPSVLPVESDPNAPPALISEPGFLAGFLPFDLAG